MKRERLIKRSALIVILLLTITLLVAQGDYPGESLAAANGNELKTANIIRLTSAEDEWLRSHKTIRVGMSPIFPPVKFSDKGVIKGIEPDYLTLLSEYTGIQFEYVICDFSVMDTKVKSGEIDMFLSFYIPERLAYMTLTEPFMEFKQIIVTRSDAPFMSSLGALKGKKLATVKGMKAYEKMLSPYPDIEAVPVGTMEEMFKAVSESKADALIIGTYVAGYLMQNYPTLRISGIVDLPPDLYFYAVRKDYPELVGILNKAIQAIPRDRFDAIVQKWFTIRLEYRPNWSEILKWAFVIGAGFSLLLGLSLFWNRRLAREIDHRRQTNEQLRFQANIIENSPVIAAYQDNDLNMVWANRAYQKATGLSLEDIRGRKCYEVWHLSKPCRGCPVIKAIETGESAAHELTPDNQDHWPESQGYWLSEAAPVRDEQGAVIGAIEFAIDITERKQAELSLRSYAERLKNLHRIDQAILQALNSPEKIAQEAILHVRDLLHCQRVSVGIFDFEKKEVRVFAATGDADSVVQIGQVLPEALYGELGILREYRLEIIEDTSNLETVPAILRTIQAEGVRSSINSPIASQKGLIGALSIGWDTARTITPEEQEIASEVTSQIAIAIEQARLLQETKRHAEELEETVRLRTAQLEATNKELEAFSYSVSHDLRAPLRHISGYVDLLNKRFREALPEKAGHYLNEITDSASQMGTLIDDLLQFSRTGRQELQQADMDMNAAVQEVLEKLKPDMKNRKLSWTVADLPRVFGDYSLLKQVWMNLLENAVKYTRYKDEARIEVGFTREPDHWAFFVRDNGVGFDMQYAHKLFGVFQRLHSQAEFEGTGIGLAHVQRIIHKHGGRVRAEGRPDEGAAFYFTIPRNTFNEGDIS